MNQPHGSQAPSVEEHVRIQWLLSPVRHQWPQTTQMSPLRVWKLEAQNSVAGLRPRRRQDCIPLEALCSSGPRGCLYCRPHSLLPHHQSRRRGQMRERKGSMHEQTSLCTSVRCALHARTSRPPGASGRQSAEEQSTRQAGTRRATGTGPRASVS